MFFAITLVIVIAQFFAYTTLYENAPVLYFEKAIAGNGVPETVTIDKRGANLAGLNAINADREMPIKIRQSKYLNNVVEPGPSSRTIERSNASYDQC